jgi:hypothetical protein
VRIPPQILEQMNNSQSEESKDASLNNSSSSSQKRSAAPSKSLNYVFKERFNFNLTSGFEEYSLKVYTSQPARAEESKDSPYHTESLEEEFKLKVAEELVTLVDQREHIKILTGKKLAVKLVLKWIYDPDIERLSELQTQQLRIEKQLYKIESSYQQALKAVQ